MRPSYFAGIVFAALLNVALHSPVASMCLLELGHPDDLLSAKMGVSPLQLRKAPTPYQRADRPMDVLHYDLDLTVSLDSLQLSGTVRATLTPLAPTDTLRFDFLSGSDTSGRGMSVSAVRVDGATSAFEHGDDLVSIPLASVATPNDTLVVGMDFAGKPLRDWILGYGLRNFFDRTDPQIPVLENEPVLETLSEPDAARSWWPCHDHPFDAATVTLSVTGPSRFELAAPGILIEDVDVGGGMRRQTWDMRTEIPSYLVSINMADYVSWEDSVQVEHLLDPATGATDTRMLRLQYFVPSFEEAAARYTWSKTGRMIQKFAEKFGPYPYADIKYGMSLFQFGGAMEHPTMSSMGQFTVSENEHPDIPGAPAGEWVSAHELCHQWFGDAVRVERWGEIWLNEGLARWSEALWFELEYGEQAARTWLDAIYRDSYPGAVVDPGELFGTTVYNKGARIVHQLRQVMGDADFFQALRNYMTDPALRFGPVNSGDFQAHFEALYGSSLDWFFTPWLTWPGRPNLRVQQYRTAEGAHLRVEQPTGRVYRLPLPIRIQFDDGSWEDRAVWVGDAGSVSDLDLATTKVVRDVVIDPDRDWLLDTEITASVFQDRSTLLTPFPNPFNPRLSIPYYLSTRGQPRIEIFDVRGRLVRRLNPGVSAAGVGDPLVFDGLDASGEALSSGVYYLRFLAPDGVEQTRKVTLLR